MNERLTQMTVLRKEANKWGDLQAGEMSPVKESAQPGLWIVCCPLCGSLGELRNHTVIENGDGTVTVSPSLICNGSVFHPPAHYERCKAHYFVDHNQIRWV